jgi:hypothetical protein
VAKRTRKKTAKRPARKAASPPRRAGAKKPLVKKQPQSKQQAAVKAGMFLYTDDAWSLRYFNDGDLHNVERQLFG